MKRLEIPMQELVEWMLPELKRGRKVAIAANGNSMIPMLYHKTSIVWLELPHKPVKKGDVVLYLRENGTYVLHRIISKTKDTFLCCGDHCRCVEAVKHEQILGIVTSFTRKDYLYECTDLPYRIYVWLLLHTFWLRTPYLRLRQRIRQRKAKKRKFNRG